MKDDKNNNSNVSFSPLVLVVGVGILVGSIVAMRNDKNELVIQKIRPTATPRVEQRVTPAPAPYYTYQPEYTYTPDYSFWYPSGNITNDSRIDYMSVSDFKNEIKGLIGRDITVNSDNALACSREVDTRYYEGSKEILSRDVFYCVDESPVYSVSYQYVRAYRNNSTNEEVVFYLDEAIPMEIYNCNGYTYLGVKEIRRENKNFVRRNGTELCSNPIKSKTL